MRFRSVGDVIAILHVVDKLQSRLRAAKGQYVDMSVDFQLFLDVLQDPRRELKGHDVPTSQQEQSGEMVTGCKKLVDELQKIEKSNTIRSDSSVVQHLITRLQWEPKEVADIRNRLSCWDTILSAFFFSEVEQVSNVETGDQESTGSQSNFNFFLL